MDLRLHQLEGFYYTGLTGGYAAAARAMPYPISEPAIYQQVRKLESALGVELCVQAAPRRTALTPEGRVLHEFVRPFFEGLPSVVRAIQTGQAAQLVIAAEGSIALDMLVPAVAKLRRSRPQLSIRLAGRDARSLLELVRSGEADAGLGVLGGSDGTLEELPLQTVHIALCVPLSHPLASRRSVPPAAALDNLPLCVYEEGQPGRELIETFFRSTGMRLRVAAEASSFETLRALVREGVAPAFVPVVQPRDRRTRKSWREPGLRIFDLTGLLPGDPITYGLLRRPGAPRHPALEQLIDLLR